MPPLLPANTLHQGPGTAARWSAALLLVLAGLASTSATALDFSISGYGTLGYARSNQSYTYQRFIDDDGTLRRDSGAGLQLDARFADKFGATVQVTAASAADSDSRYEGTVSWAFLSYRPTNDWLFRLGRQRIPLYLHSQNYDVGVTYDFARLPTEMYSISPGNDFNGVSFSKNWALEGGDLTLDGYWGQAKVDGRFWFREGLPPLLSAGAQFRGVTLRGTGLVLTYKRDDDSYRMGLHRAVGRLQNGGALSKTYPFVTLFPGVGYYQVDAAIPGPGIPTINNVPNNIIALGAEVGLGAGYRVTGEFARTYVTRAGVDIANASDRGYVAVLKSVGKWTPYLSYAFLRSEARQRDLYKRVNANSLPGFIPGAALINASQRAGADAMLVYDQGSWAVGTSYAFSATSKLKAEFMRVHVGQMSSLVDAPAGSDIRNQNINVFSLSYSVVF